MSNALHNSLAIVCVCLVACISVDTPAGSLYPDTLLGQIDSLKVIVTTGGLGLNPAPGLDRDQLSRDIRAQCEESMKRLELLPASTIESTLLVNVENAWSDRDKLETAVLVEVSVNTAATASLNPDDQSRKRYVEIWESDELLLMNATELTAEVLEVVTGALQRLEEDTHTARRRAQPKAKSP
jgi:hypothetical protein